MSDFYPLLIYLGFGGGLLLLGISSFRKTRAVRRLLSAGWATLLVLLWGLGPLTGRWAISMWSPSSVAGGWMLLEMSPALWWCALAVGLAVCGVQWVTASEQGEPLPLTGSLVVISLTVVWLVLASGSLLMTLAMWAVFDVVWFAVRLVGSTDGEQVVWGAAINGLASLVLWATSLFILQDGASELWWLMRPSYPVLTLLTTACLMRVGFYPFQVVHTEAAGRSRGLTLMGMFSPLTGVALLYRLLSLPGGGVLPEWVVGWGVISVLWAGIKSLSAGGRDRLRLACNGMLLAAVTGAVALNSAEYLVWGAGAWIACQGLLLASRRFSSREYVWFWPTLLSVGILLGVPASPFHQLYGAVLASSSWLWRLIFAVGLAFIVASLLRSAVWRAEGRVRPPSLLRLASLTAGLVIGVGGIIVSCLSIDALPMTPVAYLLWVFVLVGGMALARWGGGVRATLRRGAPVVELLDLRWLYRAAWQGAENLLGTVRVTAEVVEGSGSVLWSVLILLLVLMVVGSR